jgi:hypothetical protein
MEMEVVRTLDFEFSAAGDPWAATSWQSLQRVGKGPMRYATRAKLMYSQTGLYLLVDCEDEKLTCTGLADNADLYKEDVVEFFLWPDPTQRSYFEYEISPLGAELPIMVVNSGAGFHGWLPWHYEGARQCRRTTAVRGGPMTAGARVEGWTCRAFIPFALLVGLANVPPSPGMRWRANIYRIDYDGAGATQWAWAPETGTNFHAIKDFGTLVFA